MNKAELDKYFSRIKFNGNLKPDLETLAKLQKQHLLNIPFENLDIHINKPITISIKNFYNKIVNNKRGGFCYELNGLFNELLTAVGYQTFLISARVFDSPDKYGEEFDHLAIIVLIDEEKWLADVGFGEFAFAPLKIAIGYEQKDERGIFRINNYDEQYLVVQKKISSGWNNEYLFSLNQRNLIEFAERCNYHQTSPDSHFTQKKLCSIPIENGRITLTDKSLKFTNSDKVEEVEIQDDAHFDELLKKYFNIEI